MGYRSEVAIALTRNLFEEIKSELEEDDQDDLDTAIVEESKEQVLLHFTWIKWYPEYTLVKTIESNVKKKPESARFLVEIAGDAPAL